MSAAPRTPPSSAPPLGDRAVDAALVRRLLFVSQVCALLVTVTGLLVLVGWQAGIGMLKTIRPGLGAMAPGSALGLVFSGTALWLLHPDCDATWRGRIARVLPWVVLALGALTLAEYVLGINLGVDELFFRDAGSEVQSAHPGRISVVGALSFTLLGSALLLVRLPSRTPQRIARLMALGAALLLLVGLLGFLYGAASLYAMPIFQGVAVHTLAALLLLAAGILAVQPARGFPTLLASTGASGRLSRRLLPFAFATPLALGWLRLEGERIGLYPSEFGVDLMVVTMVTFFVAVIWWNARLLDITDTWGRRAQVHLREYADEVRDLYERAPCGYHSLDADGVFVRINDTELAWLGYARNEVIGRMRFRDLLTPASRQAFDDYFPKFKEGEAIGDTEFELQRKDGSTLLVSMSATAVRDAEGRYVMSRSTLFDITERRRAAQALQRADEQLRVQLGEIEQIYRYAPVGLCNFDRDCRYLRINERMAEINGLSVEAHVGRTIEETIPHLAPTLRALWRPIFEAGTPVLDIEVHGRTPRDPDNDHDWLASYFPLRSETGDVIGLTAVVLDITERKRTEQALRESEAAVRAMSLTDALTGLANRRRLDEGLHSEVHRVERYGGRLSVVITDLDHFKRINDDHGHQVGDALLCEFAQIIRGQCRDVDLVTRFGGEEFVILMPEVGAAEAQACAERMRLALAQAVIPPLTQAVFATFGVAELARGESEASLLRRADKALYRGKAEGRNCVVLAEVATAA
jgi:diguanylate cyclase (GGDEF)-like protein/PAS domain S-box-containing protein